MDMDTDVVWRDFYWVAIRIPEILACLFLVIALFMKFGKERGAGFLLSGGLGLLALQIAYPVLYQGILPQVIRDQDPEVIDRIFMGVGFLLALIGAGAIVLLAIGTLMRAATPTR